MRAVYSYLLSYCTDTDYETVFRQCNHLLPDTDADSSFNQIGGGRSSKRRIKPNEKFGDFILTESSGIYQRSNENDDNDCKRLYFEILDLIIELFHERLFLQTVR